MGVLITSENFVVKYAVAKTAYSDLDAFINDNEEQLIVDLMGAVMYADFKSTLNNSVPVVGSNPNSQGYVNIYNSFYADWGADIYKSKGMVLMLTAFIYFMYMKQVMYQATSQGTVVNSSDTGKNVNPGNLYQYWNEAIDSYKAIQEYIQNIHPELFNIGYTTPFNGQEKTYGISLFQ